MNDSKKLERLKNIKSNINQAIKKGDVKELKININIYEMKFEKLDLKDEDIDMYSCKAILAIYKNEIVKAKEILKEGLDKDSTNFDLLYNLAFCYQIEKNYKKATRFYLKARMNANQPDQINDIQEAMNELSFLSNYANKKFSRYDKYFFDFEKLDKKIISNGNFSKKEFLKHHKRLDKVNDYFNNLNNKEKKDIINYIEKLSFNNTLLSIYKYSFLFKITGNKRYIYNIFDLNLSQDLDIKEKHFLLWQLNREKFMYSNLTKDNNFDVNVRKFYRSIYDEYKKKLNINYELIPFEDRNQNRIIVMTNQFLNVKHAPTRRVLDYCVTLKRDLGKEVFLINLANVSRYINLPYYKPFIANHIDEYSKKDKIKFEGEDINFYQSNSIMLNKDETNKILKFVADYNPQFVFSVGGSSLTADLCSQFTTVATLPCSFNIPITEGNLLVLGRELKKEDEYILDSMEISKSKVVETFLTYRKPRQNSVLSRKDFGIPEEVYLIVIVGTRLHEEISKQYLVKIADFLLNNEDIHILFVGKFKNYDELISDNEVLKRCTHFIGYQEDIMAVYEICDIYLNPPREGGGSSAAQALYKEVPVFTRDFGDASYVVGQKNCYHSFKRMIKDIIKFKEDKMFCSKLKRRAKKRAIKIFNTKLALNEILQEIEN